MPDESTHDAGKFSYTVLRSPRRRTMAVFVDRGRVIVRAPVRLPLRKIEEFVKREEAWVLRKLGESLKRLEEAPAHGFADGEMLPYAGHRYPMRLMAGKRNGVRLADREIIVTLAPGTDADRVPGMVRKWYIATAREVFLMRAAYYSAELGLKPPGISVRDQKRRWGSCSSSNRINLNWRLMTAPVGVLDYVIAHELCHIIHRDHSKRFWGLLSTIVPEYRECRKWLRENGHTLGL